MDDLTCAYEIKNIRRAWRWIKSNPDATYKNYCRSLYTSYAIADEDALDDLRDRLKRRIYEPSHATKIYFPKGSGILRPYSILTVEDQIVYQSLINVVAEKLIKRMENKYFKEVFGHLYAGKKSAFFYRKWTSGYKKLNEACRKAFNDGFVYGASFDLTACYDSLDHGVLRHFLSKIGCDEEFSHHLTDCLSRWTATNHRIYHHHGIPQGPLASGLLSEVVLRHFDIQRGSTRQVRYLRYVDDIRLYANSSDALRRMLVKLDMLSKDIGLFPQSSKIHIHRIKNIETEIKSLSNPPELVLKPSIVNQKRLYKRLVELSPRYRVNDVTRFKYMLASAEPCFKLNERVWRIYENHPELYGNIMRYFQRYSRLPKKVSNRLLSEIDKSPLYNAIHTEMLSTVDGRLDELSQKKLDRIIKKQWKPKLLTPDLQVAIGRIGIANGLFTYAQIRYALRSLQDWWARSQLVRELTDEYIGKPSVEFLINDRMKHDVDGDVCMMAAHVLDELDAEVIKPYRTLNRRAALIARKFGRIRRASGRICGIENALNHLMTQEVNDVKWKDFFKNRYKHAERQIISCRALADTNITAFVPALDVFNDLLLNALYKKDVSLGSYTLGKIGSVLNSTRLKFNYPSTFELAKVIHEKRLESELAHPIVRKTGKPTGRIKYSFLRKAKNLIYASCTELKVKFY